jgi:hypothetical protein
VKVLGTIKYANNQQVSLGMGYLMIIKSAYGIILGHL